MKLVRTFGLALGVSFFAASMAHAISTQEPVDSPVTASVDAQGNDSKWFPLKSICFSNSRFDITIARKSCEDAVETVHLMSNDKLVFQASCAPALSTDRCTYYNGYLMTVKALIVSAN
jgi:hypothetical protein